MGLGDDKGLLNRGGETIKLRDITPKWNLCKEGDSSTSSSVRNDTDKWYMKIWKRDKLMIFIILGVLLGFMVGLLCNSPIQNLEQPTKSTVLTMLGFPGEIFMRMLKMLILPLIMTSLIVGLAELDQRASGSLGSRAIIYYMGTTTCAVLLGIVLVVAIYPGGDSKPPDGDSKPPDGEEKREVRAIDSILDLIRNMFPDNLVKACIFQLTTSVKTIKINKFEHTWDKNISTHNATNIIRKKYGDMATELITELRNGTNATFFNTWKEVKIAGNKDYGGGTNILGIVVFSLAVGILLGRMGKRARGFVEWVIVFNDIIMELVTLVIWYSPIGIWSLIAAKFASMDDISGTFEKLLLYMVTVIIGLIIHSFIILPGIYLVSTRKNPLTFVVGIIKALLTAFGTSSSSATLPVTFRCLEENNAIDKRITRFVLPIGATINMDGTALYEAVSAIFIAQASGMTLSFGQYIAVSVTATLASIGAAGIPQAGLVTMLIVLQTIGLPEDAISLILSVDWFLDRMRTTVYVLGDAFGAGIVAHFSKGDLRRMDIRQEERRAAEDRMLEEGFNFSHKEDLASSPPTVNTYKGLTVI